MSRRIEWELTFEQWVEWWGDDIELRGQGSDNLQMQRINDTGPYALGNIVKGTPKQNTATANEQREIKYAALVASGYVWEERKRPTVADGIGDPIEDLDPPYEGGIDSQEYGRAKPLGLWI